MKTKIKAQIRVCVVVICVYLIVIPGSAQTEHDGIMMNKGQWCNGVTYMHSQWEDYWEGTFKRSNANIGTITTQSLVFMTNYGITGDLNIMASLPYVTTKASLGTLHGFKGVQDASVFLKWRALKLGRGEKKLSVFALAGISTPATTYNLELLPLSIGLGTTNLTGRIMADYQMGHFFATAGAAYVARSNVNLDRTSYYDTEIHYTNEVKMPHIALYNFSAGIRKRFLIVEALVNNATTLGGFDMRKNDMPFPSNRMNGTTVGLHTKYTLPFYSHIELTGDVSKVVAGRNIGQATTLAAGIFYLFTFKNKKP